MVVHKTIYECVAGSRMHNTHTPDSDRDTRVIYRDSIYDRLSPFHGTETRHDKYTDTVYYELTHFAKMLAKCSPTVIEMCYAREYKGDASFISELCTAAMDTTKYVSQCNGMILGMLNKSTPKTLHHAARIHTHLQLYVDHGILQFDASKYDNYTELMAIKRGEVGLHPNYTTKVEVKKLWDTQNLDKVSLMVYNRYLEDVWISTSTKTT